MSMKPAMPKERPTMADARLSRSRSRAVAATLALVLLPLASRAGTLDVAVHGVRTAKGFVRVAVCDKATFLTEYCQYFADAPAVVGTTTLSVPNVAPGVYAIQAFDDDTGGGVIHQGLFGIPREGIGFSNNARLHLRGPKFSEAAVTVGDDAKRINLRLRYLHSFHPTEENLAGR
jgi:uncharacterized protein (DUF2141 family)